MSVQMERPGDHADFNRHIHLSTSGEEKTYLHLVLDYFLVLTAIFSVFTCCVSGLYMLQSRLSHIYKFIALQLVLVVTALNTAAVPRLLMTSDESKCELFAILDHYLWIVLHAWVCSLAFECLQDSSGGGGPAGAVHTAVMPLEEYRRRAWLHCILCYLLPVVIMGVTALGHYTNPIWLGKLYGGRYCSMENVGLFMFASVLPSSISIILGVFFLLIAIFRYQPAPPPLTLTHPGQAARARQWLINALVLIFLSGLCWCVHLFYNIIRSTPAFYFSTLAEQMKAGLLSLLIIYNARYEKRLEVEQLQEKLRALSLTSIARRHDVTAPPPPFYSTYSHSMHELRSNRLSRHHMGGYMPRSATSGCMANFTLQQQQQQQQYPRPDLPSCPGDDYLPMNNPPPAHTNHSATLKHGLTSHGRSAEDLDLAKSWTTRKLDRSTDSLGR